MVPSPVQRAASLVAKVVEIVLAAYRANDDPENDIGSLILESFASASTTCGPLRILPTESVLFIRSAPVPVGRDPRRARIALDVASRE